MSAPERSRNTIWSFPLPPENYSLMYRREIPCFPILLLDEATSALDVATERKVLRNIMQDTYPRTCIVTTHRPTVLNICTRVYAIQDKKCEVLSEEEIRKMMNEF